MVKENLYKSYSIDFYTEDVCSKREHTHSFFELVYIQSGTGIHSLNQGKCSYKAKELYLLTPEDSHYFEIETTTNFFFLRFNNSYLQKNNFDAENINRLQFILQNANHHPGCILQNLGDRSLVPPIIESIYNEHVLKEIYSEEMVHQLVNMLIVIVARNIAQWMPESAAVLPGEKAMNILQYIQQHICEPDKLKAAHLSDVFAISNAYLSRYFKRHTNETMQQYIIKYKINLIGQRLRFSNMRINEIAEEFGFADASHLNKYFKKQQGFSLKEFRKTMKVQEGKVYAL